MHRETFKRQSVRQTVITACLGVLLATNAVASDSTNSVTVNQTSAQAADSKQPATLAELLAVPPDQLEKADIAWIDLLCAKGLHDSDELNVEDRIGISVVNSRSKNCFYG